MNWHTTIGDSFMKTEKISYWCSLLIAIGPTSWSLDATAGQPESSVSAATDKALAQMKAKGPDASLAILPVRLGGKTFEQASAVIGVLLEQQGLKNIEIRKAVFERGTKGGMEEVVATLGDVIQQNAITNDYALYAEFNGSPQSGLEDLRAVLVDKGGNAVWTLRGTPQEEEFKQLKHADPMELCVFLVGRLAPQFGLNEATAKGAKPGKLAKLMEERSGLPSESERAAGLERQKAMKAAMPRASLEVFPARVQGKEARAESATNITRLIGEASLCQAVVSKQAPVLKTSLADPNEMKGLWAMAAEFRAYVRSHPPQADYVLHADYVFDPNNWEQGFVHFVVCDRKGEWVIVDMQNSHWPDYQNIRPTSAALCDQLVVRRIQGYLE
jgi:hypothetical protein